MAHQASYRLYRPRRFSEVQGQTRTVDTLREAVRQGRLTHAYLFSGPRGTGKTSVARILAKAVNCENLGTDGDPCLQCASCQSIDSNQNLDVIEIDAASNRGIDEIRDIKERITHQTAMSQYKVYIIDEVHMLTAEAFNAFLKTLEEPPAHALFVLATTEAHKLPVTVLSRCQRYEFKRLSVPIIRDRLRYVAQQEGVQAEPEALELLAEAADGALRDALSLFDQVVAVSQSVTVEGVTRAAGMVGQTQMQRLVEGLSLDIESLVQVLSELRQDGLDEKLILRDLARQLRDVMLYRTAGPDLFPTYRRDALRDIDRVLPQHVDPTWWIDAADQLAQAESRLRGGFPPDLAVELACLKVQQGLLGQPAASPPQAPPPMRAVPSESPVSDTPVPTPQSEPAAADNASGPGGPGTPDKIFQSVLDMVKRERPSTYALFEKTVGVVGPDGLLTIYFEFPAHRKLMEQGNNREVVDRAVRSVFGPETPYRFMDGPPPSESPPQEAASSARSGKAPPSRAAVREWFGDQATLVGFDQES